MAPESKEYGRLPRGSVDEWSTETFTKPSQANHRFSPWNWPTILITLLAISLTSNVFLVVRSAKPPVELKEADCPSFYAGLKRDIPTPIVPFTEYTIPEHGENPAADLLEVSPLWDKLRGDPGVLALTSEYQDEKKLHSALPFPWDDDKNVYFFQAYHNLHCLRTLFRYVNYTESGQPNKIAASHAVHCLDQLRQDVICQADDTPRYASSHPSGTGWNQVRMCKDWKKLEKFSYEHTACFKNTDGISGPIIERFKSCPDGKVLWPTDDKKEEKEEN